jgi:hypothetical protein
MVFSAPVDRKGSIFFYVVSGKRILALKSLKKLAAL